MPLTTARHDLRLIADLLTTAEREARALGDPEPGAEHLLLAALLLDDDSARRAVPTDAETVRAAIAAVHAAALAAVGVEAPPNAAALPAASGAYRADVSAQQVFQRARELARRSPTGLRAAHVLIAVAEREHGTAARVLQQLGHDRAAVIAAAERALGLSAS